MLTFLRLDFRFQTWESGSGGKFHVETRFWAQQIKNNPTPRRQHIRKTNLGKSIFSRFVWVSFLDQILKF